MPQHTKLHPALKRQLDKLYEKHPTFQNGLAIMVRLIHEKFGTRPGLCISHLFRIATNAGVEFWKVRVQSRGISNGQCPRLVFCVVEGVLYLVGVGTHEENYESQELTTRAVFRYKQMRDGACEGIEYLL